MPIAIVHGVPETSAIWSRLVAALAARGREDVTLLSPPGFGVPLPAGFEPTRSGYAAWLAGELEALGGGVDLVGHDWGAGHVFGALALRPALVRSWAADCSGLLHPGYVWHEMAQAWQTPEVGEQVIAEMLGSEPGVRAAGLQEAGLPEDVALELAAHQNDDMGRAILSLYRSGAQPEMQRLGEGLAAAELPPGLTLMPTADPYVGPPENTEAVAGMLRARLLRLPGEGHWWMFGPAVETVAEALVEHWSGV